MYKYVLMMAMCWSSQFLYAQNAVEGTVKNETGELVPNAYVSIPELKIVAITDIDGRFTLNNIPKGKFILEITHQGYEQFEKTVNIPSNNTLDINLKPSVKEIEEVVVLGQSYRELTQNTYPISTLDSKKLVGNGSISIQESMAKLPGVSIFNNGPGISKPVLHGLTGSRIAIVNNGFAISQQQWQNEHGMSLFTPGVDQVQIIKGPSSLLYGEGAFGGTVQLISEKEAPMNTTVGDVNASIFSNTLGMNTDIGIKGTTEKLGWIVRAGAQSHADYYSQGKRAPNTRFGAYIFKGTLNLHRNNGISTLSYDYTNTSSGIIEAHELLFPEKESRFEREYEGPHHTIQLHNINLKNTFFTSNGKLNLNVNAQLNSRKEIEGMEDNSIAIGNLTVQSNTFIEQALYTFYIGSKNELSVGGEAKQQTFENSEVRILIPDATTETYSGYVINNLTLDNLSLQGGLRFDHKTINSKAGGTSDTLNNYPAFNKDFSQWNGNLGANWKINAHLSFQLNAGAGTRVPNLAELASNGIHEGTTRYEIGSTDLKVEQNIQYDASVRLNYPKFGLMVNAFYNDINDFIYLEESNEDYFGYTKYYFKQEDAHFQGVDVGLNWSPVKSLRFNHNFSSVVAKQNDGEYLPFIPAFSLINDVEFSLPDRGRFNQTRLNMSVRNYFDQHRVAVNETQTAGYTLLDAGIKTVMKMGDKNVIWGLQVNNLLDEKYYNHLSFIKDLGVPNMGRNVSISTKIPLQF